MEARCPIHLRVISGDVKRIWPNLTPDTLSECSVIILLRVSCFFCRWWGILGARVEQFSFFLCIPTLLEMWLLVWVVCHISGLVASQRVVHGGTICLRIHCSLLPPAGICTTSAISCMNLFFFLLFKSKRRYRHPNLTQICPISYFCQWVCQYC